MISIQVSFFPVCHLIWINRIEIYRHIGQILKIHGIKLWVLFRMPPIAPVSSATAE